jgi:uncharacterized protein (DUF302 family)
MTVLASAHGPGATMDREVAAAGARGMTVFARIDHAAGAAAAGLALPPTEVVLLGNARAGTPLMREARKLAIDLPLKLLVWQDEDGTWLAYDEPRWLAARHGIDGGNAEPVLARMTDGAGGGRPRRDGAVRRRRVAMNAAGADPWPDPWRSNAHGRQA